jgi:hypothetical protein
MVRKEKYSIILVRTPENSRKLEKTDEKWEKLSFKP